MLQAKAHTKDKNKKHRVLTSVQKRWKLQKKPTVLDDLCKV